MQEQSATRPDLSVVIVSHNVEPLLRGCLESLARECEGLDAEVFVVDSASSDATVETVGREFPTVRLIASPDNLGFSAGNNVALKLCRGRYILLLNPDTVVHAGALRALMSFLDEHPRAGMAGPMLRLEDASVQLEAARNLPTLWRLVPWLLLLDKLQFRVLDRRRTRTVEAPPPKERLFDRYCLFFWSRDRACEVEAISGACMMLRREVVERIGLLDEDVPLYLDDMDYCRRTRDAGLQVHYRPESQITHLSRRSTSQLRRDGDIYAMQCHALWAYLRKHESRFDAALFVAVSAVAALARIAVWTLPSLAAGEGRREARRRLGMAAALARWAFAWPRRAPKMSFAREGQAGRLTAAGESGAG